MKKLVIYISFLLIIVGVAVEAIAVESIFFGTWVVPWNDSPITLQVKNESPVPGTVIVIYFWDNKGNGL